MTGLDAGSYIDPDLSVDSVSLSQFYSLSLFPISVSVDMVVSLIFCKAST
jgi:hypothetical protein